MAGQNTW